MPDHMQSMACIHLQDPRSIIRMKVSWTKLSTNSPTPDCVSITAREPRGKHYYNGASGKGGPDATFVHPNGDITHVDASGINPYSHTHQNSGLPAKLPLKPRQTFSWQAFSPRSKLQAGHVTTLGCRPLIIGIGPRTRATTP